MYTFYMHPYGYSELAVQSSRLQCCCMSTILLAPILLFFVKKYFALRIQILSLRILHFIIAHFAFITAQIGYHCTLKLGMV